MPEEDGDPNGLFELESTGSVFPLLLLLLGPLELLFVLELIRLGLWLLEGEKDSKNVEMEESTSFHLQKTRALGLGMLQQE